MIYNYILRGTSAMHRAATKLSQKALARKVEQANKFKDSIEVTHAKLLKAVEDLRVEANKSYDKRVMNIAVEAAKCQVAQVSAVQK